MEKRLVAAVAAVLCALLVFCTGMARKNFEASLPHVQAQQVQTDSDGTILLPADAISPKPDGTFCVWKLTREPGAFGSERYWVKEVRISCTERPEGLMVVQGLYDLSAPYVTSTAAPLSDGIEVILDIPTY